MPQDDSADGVSRTVAPDAAMEPYRLARECTGR